MYRQIMSQPGQGQSGFASARRANAQRAAQNQPLPDPANNNSQGQDNSQTLADGIQNLVQRVRSIKDPIVQFITQTEPQFIRDLLAKIEEIQNALNQLAIDDALVDRITALRSRSDSARTDIERLTRELQQSQQQYQQANEAVVRLQAEVDQGRNQYSALEQEKARVQQLYDANNIIMNNAVAAIQTFQREIAELETLTNQISTNTAEHQRVKNGLEAINNLVSNKLSAYGRMMGQLQQQGGMRSKGRKRTKKNKGRKMSGGYSYPSAGYEGAQEIVVAPSRSARSRSRRSSSSRRQSRRRPRTI